MNSLYFMFKDFLSSPPQQQQLVCVFFFLSPSCICPQFIKVSVVWKATVRVGNEVRCG